jgi:hypothetical protein
MAEIYFDRLPNPKREYAVRAWAASAVIAVNSDRPFECRSIRRSQRIASAIFFNGAAMELRFETRGLPPRGEYLKSTDLCEGEAYFIVDYSDAALLIPQLTPVVFVGRDIETRGSGKVYFQDIDSYISGVRLEDPHPDADRDAERGLVYKFVEDQPAVFDYEGAVDELLRCYLRRREIKTS